MAWFSISRDTDSRLLSGLNGKSMVQGAVGITDLALWWCQKLLQVQFTFVFEKINMFKTARAMWQSCLPEH